MDWKKYDLVPTEFATAKEIGLAPATLGAMARRGFVEVLNSTPKQYRKINGKASTIHRLCEENKDDYNEFFSLHRAGEPLNMLCYFSPKGDIVDCWGEIYDLSNIDRVEFNTRRFDV